MQQSKDMTIDIRGCQEQRRFNAVKSVVRFYCYEGAIRVDLITRVNCHVGNGTLGTENDPAMVPNVHVRAQSMGIDVVVRIICVIIHRVPRLRYSGSPRTAVPL